MMDILIHSWNVSIAALTAFTRAAFAPKACAVAVAVNLIAYGLDPRPAWLAFALVFALAWAVLGQVRIEALARSSEFVRTRADVNHAERVRIDALLTEAVQKAIREGGLSRMEVLKLRDRSQFQCYSEVWRIGR